VVGEVIVEAAKFARAAAPFLLRLNQTWQGNDALKYTTYIIQIGLHDSVAPYLLTYNTDRTSMIPQKLVKSNDKDITPGRVAGIVARGICLVMNLVLR
jgi:hypothetical protein